MIKDIITLFKDLFVWIWLVIFIVIVFLVVIIEWLVGRFIGK